MFQESITTQESMGHIINAKSLRLRQAFRSQAVSFLPRNCLFACVICEVMLRFLKKNDLKMSESHIATSRAVGQHHRPDASSLRKFPANFSQSSHIILGSWDAGRAFCSSVKLETSLTV